MKTKANKINAVKGMNDILPIDSFKWLWLENVLMNLLKSYGYENIRTPIVEFTQLFIRAIGEVTDIVEKEMYSFIDCLNQDELTLRPEGTAGIVRAVLEHGLLHNKIQKLWYLGPMFRHEKPQKGRYRQFHQLGVEVFGISAPTAETELIVMQQHLWQNLKLEGLQLQINCIGSLEERNIYKQNLIKYFEKHILSFDKELLERLYKNPLRILDSKLENLQDLINSAPKLIDYLNDDSLNHYQQWKSNLQAMDIDYVENYNLVRGLDYYNLSVFEWVTDSLGSQATVAAGGRYDSLVQYLGGKACPAVGFAIGIERLMLLLEAKHLLNTNIQSDVAIIAIDANAIIVAMQIAKLLRTNGFNVTHNLVESGLKGQLSKANELNVPLVVVIGENEISTNQVMVKSMHENSQEMVKITDILGYVANKIVK